MKKFLFTTFAFTAVAMLPSCSSDSTDGDLDYYTRNELVVKMDDESKMHFANNGDGTAMVTYDRSNSIHLNENNQSKITTYVGSVTVPESITADGKTYTVTGVDEMAFANNTSLTSLSLPETIKSFGQGAFTNCTAMTAVNIPSQITDIPSACFAQCKKMAKFELPAGVKTVGTLAFANCAKATTITLNDGLTEISDRAFLGCTTIKEISVPASVTKIGGNAFFRASKLTKIHVKATIPPILGDSLGDYISKATLYVPKGSKSTYEADKLWNKFKTIVEE